MRLDGPGGGRGLVGGVTRTGDHKCDRGGATVALVLSDGQGASLELHRDIVVENHGGRTLAAAAQGGTCRWGAQGDGHRLVVFFQPVFFNLEGI